MTTTDAEDAGASPLERGLPLVTGVLVALPTLVAHYPPMTDLGLHEGALGVLRHFWDEAYFPRGLYTLNLGHANQLFYIVAWPLSYLVGTMWAAKLVIAASQVLIFTGGGRLADHLERSRWSVLLFAPLALGFTYYWGLVTNLVGFAVFFYALPLLDVFVARPTPRGLAWATFSFVLLYLAHESVLAMGVAVLLALTLARPFSARATGLRLLPGLAALAILAFNHAHVERIKTDASFFADMTYLPFASKVLLFSNVLFGSHEPAIRHLLLAVALAYLGALLISRRRAAEPRVEPAGRLRELALRYRFEVIGLALLLGYWVVPYNLRGATLLHERFVGPAWGILAICAAPRGPVMRVGKLLGAVLPAGVLLVAWPQFADANAMGRDLDAILDAIPRGRAVTFCSLNLKGAGNRVYSAPASAARSLAVVGGRAGRSLLDSPIAPVQLRPDAHWFDYELREFFYSSRGFKPAHDFRRFEWVIAQSRRPDIREMMGVAFAPEAELVASRGEWMLFRSRLETAALDARDEPAPQEMETVLDRINFLVAKRHGLPLPPEPPGLRNGAREP